MLRTEEPLTHRKEGETLSLKGETPVATGRMAAGNGWQEVTFDRPAKGRYVCLEALDAQDGKDYAAIAELYLLDAEGKPLSRQKWQIDYADSESTSWGNYAADKVYDLQESTYWVRYLPRAEEGAPGAIKGYKVYVKETPFDR